MTQTTLYTVLKPFFLLGGKRVKIGEISLSDSEAKRPLSLGCISPASDAAANENTEGHAAIIKAINGLDNADPELWTQTGKPKTEALSELLGAEVTAAARDHAWETLQASE